MPTESRPLGDSILGTQSQAQNLGRQFEKKKAINQLQKEDKRVLEEELIKGAKVKKATDSVLNEIEAKRERKRQKKER